MVQQIGSADSVQQMPQQNPLKGSPDTQKTDSFGSLLQTAVQKAQPFDSKTEKADRKSPQGKSEKEISRKDLSQKVSQPVVLPADNPAAPPETLFQLVEKSDAASAVGQISADSPAAAQSAGNVMIVGADGKILLGTQNLDNSPATVKTTAESGQEHPVQHDDGLYRSADPIQTDETAGKRASKEPASQAVQEQIPESLPSSVKTGQATGRQNVQEPFSSIPQETNITVDSQRPVQSQAILSDEQKPEAFAKEKAEPAAELNAPAADSIKTAQEQSGIKTRDIPLTQTQKPVQNSPAEKISNPQPVQKSTDNALSKDAAESGDFGVQAQPADVEEKKPEQRQADSGIQTQQFSDLYAGGKVVVKVSDTAQSTKASAGKQVSDAITTGLKNGKKELQINLYPQSLGKVSVKLTSENGVLTVEIAAQNPKTQSMLASSSGDIRSLLQSSTGQSVQITKPEQNAQWQNQDGGSNQSSAWQQQQQQQQQNEDRQQNSQAWYSFGNTGGISTGDFLSMVRQLGA